MLNNKPFKKLVGSRASWFRNIDRPAMKALPQLRYEDEEWKKARVHPDYHIEVNKHWYSVPYQLIGKQLDVRITATVVECFFRNNRIASHPRDDRPAKHSTQREHMPKSHQKYLDWTPERLENWASTIGPAVRKLVVSSLAECDHPQQGFRRCLGLLSLEKIFGAARLEQACKRALFLNYWSVSSIRSTLKHGLDQKVIQLPLPIVPLQHENVRGPEYYQEDA